MEGLGVTVDRVVYLSNAQTPPDRPNAFAYFITIRNESTATVTVKGRKWVITGDDGEITAVEADGVVGRFPRLEPGTSFSYNSFHVTDRVECRAEGSYLVVTDDGQKVVVRIPPFVMRVAEEA